MRRNGFSPSTRGMTQMLASKQQQLGMPENQMRKEMQRGARQADKK